MIVVFVLLVIFIGLYFALSLNGQLKKQLRDLDDHKQQCFDSIGRPRGAAARQQTTSALSNSKPAPPEMSLTPATGVPKRFSIR